MHIKKIIFSLLLSLGIFGVIVSPVYTQQEDETEKSILPQEIFFKAIVTDEPTETTINDYLQPVLRQHVPIQIINGTEKGKEMILDFDIPQSTPGITRLEKSNKVIIAKSIIAEEETYYISDIYRLNMLWVMLALFIILIIILARWGGVRAIVGLFISFIIIISFIIPRIIEGQNALVIGLIGTILIATISIYTAHGFRSRTTIAFISTTITIFLALLLSMFFIDLMHLFGLGSEEAFFLQASPGKIFNLKGILIAGIIIGTLGVLDDITTAQAAVVEELHRANSSLSLKELFIRGSSVGREHIISLVNTLILAYTGASLPLLLLFQIYNKPAWIVLNSEIIMEEIVRMLIGSISLALAVPLTTYLAAWYYSRHHQKSVS